MLFLHAGAPLSEQNWCAQRDKNQIPRVTVFRFRSARQKTRPTMITEVNISARMSVRSVRQQHKPILF
jgi:hypothetical protein